MRGQWVPEGGRRDADLSVREVRRLADLVVASESTGRPIVPLTVMVPGLSLAEARLIRDFMRDRQLRNGERTMALIARGHCDSALITDRMIAPSPLSVNAGALDLYVQGVMGCRFSPDGGRASGPEGNQPVGCDGLVLGLEVIRDPFGTADVEEEDLVAVNGCAHKLVYGQVSETSGLPDSEYVRFRIEHNGRVSCEGYLSTEDSATESTARMTRRAMGSELVLEASNWAVEGHESSNNPNLVFSRVLAERIPLANGDRITLHADGLESVTVLGVSSADATQGVL